MMVEIRSVCCTALGAVLLALLLTACPAGVGGDCSKVPSEVCSNCKTNLEIAPVDLKQCAGGAADGCTSLRKDLTQLAAVNPANKQSADAALAHVDACSGKGDSDTACTAISDALKQIKCETNG